MIEPTTDQDLDLDPAQAQLWELAERSRQLGETSTALQAERDTITAQLRALGLGEHRAGPLTVRVAQAHRFDPKAAELLLSPELLASITSTRVDPDLAKRTLPPAVYDACKTAYGQPRVSFE